jgi:tRNA (mo5U34)-methyltransferase
VPEAPTSSELDELRREVAALRWYHSIDLGNGVVTPGTPPNDVVLARGLPSLAGRSVLDIGAWDGFFSFAAERAGATRVVALDHYAWLVDFDARNEYWARCEADGVLPDPDRDLADFARPDTLPGRRGFDLARRVLRSAVIPVVGDFMALDPVELGTFDVVLFLGVLYHLRDPLAALRRVRALTAGVAVVETEAVAILGMPRAELLSFTPGAELRGDHTNWFAPSAAALAGMCRAAGFGRVDVRIGPPPRRVQLRAATGRAAHTARERTRQRLRARALVAGAAGDRPARGTAAPDWSGVALHRYRITVHAHP